MNDFEQFKLKVREAFSEYIKSEGCSCCQDTPRHVDAANKLGELLGYKEYDEVDQGPRSPKYNLYEVI